MKVIQTQNLTKDYGDGKGIFDINLEIEQGEMVGFAGTNGSGKTTTIRSILGFVRPSGGQAFVNGLPSWQRSADIFKSVGYVPGEIAFPDLRTGTEFLKSQAYFSHLNDMSYANELIEKLQLDPTANLKRMSKGMKQKTAIVAALMNDLPILILDEPTTGLDPLMRESFLEIIAAEHAKGKTIFMSSHMFEELEALCDRVALISDGHIVDTVDMQDIRQPKQREYKVEFVEESDYRKFKTENFVIVRDQPQYNQLTVKIDGSAVNALFGALSQYRVRLISEVKYNLDKYFKKTLSQKGEPKDVQ